ncbi:MAG: hypothetical protein H0W68_11700 [Gemmatimonadaceae bacterium]|nr:hypothetical protein [Gemmatimonadaceae bacterium]
MTCSLRPWLCSLLVIGATSRPLGAQQTVIDAGLSIVHFTQDSSTVAGPSLRVVRALSAGPFFGALSVDGVATFGAVTGAASLQGGVRQSVGGSWLAEASTELITVQATGTRPASTALGGVRLLRGDAAGSFWFGADGHGSVRGHGILGGGSASAGGMRRVGTSRLAASVAREWTEAELYSRRFRTGYAGRVPVRYDEARLSLVVESDHATVAVGGGVRRDPDALRLYDVAASVTSAVWLSDTRAFTVGLSRTLPDFVRGADGADVLTIGLRFGPSSPARLRADHALVIVSVTAPGDGAAVLHIRADGARRVQMMGDFSDWQPVEMAYVAGSFRRELRAAPGTHHVMVRVDDGEWRPPSNTPSVADDFGGHAGLLVVP